MAVAPVTVTDRTSALVLGIEPRAYRAFVVRERIPHARLGRRIVARIEDILAALDRLAGKIEPPVAPFPDEEAEQPETADAVLALLGRKRSR
jgi:hypothetical protein